MTEFTIKLIRELACTVEGTTETRAPVGLGKDNEATTEVLLSARVTVPFAPL